MTDTRRSRCTIGIAQELAMTVIEEVAAERKRQIEQEGWTPDHDDSHGSGSMAQAGACYALSASGNCHSAILTEHWPWAREWWKPKDARRDLVRAAALLVAEIERLDRK